MTPRSAASSRHAVDSCTIQLHAWKPFHHIDPSPKKPCRSDRSTNPHSEALDLSRLSLLEDPPPPPPPPHRTDHSFRWFAPRKRRRRGSRSVSGRSSDRSGTHRRRSSAAAYATCSDFPLAAGGTDSSGELFANGEGSWGSDVSEARAFSSRREMGREVGAMEREILHGGGAGQGGGGGGGVELLPPGNESGYGSEPGYRGDGEFGYGDEFDEEDEDGRHLFWGDRFGAAGGGDADRMEIVGENNFLEQKTHHRCRRKKHMGE